MERIALSWSVWILALSMSSGCTFDPKATLDNGDIDAGVEIDGAVTEPSDGAIDEPDATPDAALQVCEPDQDYCDGRMLQRCNADGTGPVEGMAQTCDFTCSEAKCVYASNIPDNVYAACDDTAPALAPPAGATVTFTEPIDGSASIVCSPKCNMENTTTIDELVQFTNNETAWFCLSVMDIPADVTIDYGEELEEAVILLVDDTAQIAGTVDFRGRDGTMASGGDGGPGAGNGANPTADNGVDGDDGTGPCPGLGGTTAKKNGSDYAAGGGGGGGHGGNGGKGGIGRNPDDDKDATGGNEGSTCGNAELVPLDGGSGGGAGADATCGGVCGWAAGGGGGAIQISARTSITITGTVDTSGGNGHGVKTGDDAAGGAGGGGSGGAILLESLTIDINGGSLVADGGNGGDGAGDPGGAGGSGSSKDGSNGGNYTDAGQGGSGGGGGGGRVRINTAGDTTKCGAFVSPEPVCSNGNLANSPQ